MEAMAQFDRLVAAFGAMTTAKLALARYEAGASDPQAVFRTGWRRPGTVRDVRSAARGASKQRARDGRAVRVRAGDAVSQAAHP